MRRDIHTLYTVWYIYVKIEAENIEPYVFFYFSILFLYLIFIQIIKSWKRPMILPIMPIVRLKIIFSVQSKTYSIIIIAVYDADDMKTFFTE